MIKESVIDEKDIVDDDLFYLRYCISKLAVWQSELNKILHLLPFCIIETEVVAIFIITQPCCNALPKLVGSYQHSAC